MFLVFFISQTTLGTWIANGYEFENGTVIPGLVTLLESFQGWVGELLEGANPLLSAILVDGVIGGVIAVIGFLPLVMVMYFLIALLEDCGYMARASVVLDPIFKKVGLSGKSIIPFVIGIGCAVPGMCRRDSASSGVGAASDAGTEFPWLGDGGILFCSEFYQSCPFFTAVDAA